MIVEADGDIGTDDVIYLRDNMPDLTAIDILKIFAYINGKVLWYDSENQKITFEDLDVNNYPIFPLDNVVEVSQIRRTFGDYAQKNLLRYTSPEGMRSSDIITKAYVINNANIDIEKELYKIPFSEGRRYGDSNLLLVRSTDNNTLATRSAYRLNRTDISLNNVLQTILDNSTTIDVSAEISLFDFNKIQDKMRIFYDNAYWVWIDASWSNEIARLTLARV
jgi:hypothetical protein